MNLEKDSLGILKIVEYALIVVGAFFGTLTAGITAYYGLKKNKKKEDAKQLDIADLKSHSFFDVMRNEQLDINSTVLHLDHEKKIVEVKRYLTLKIEWWRTLVKTLISREFLHDGEDMLNSTYAFGKFMYGSEGFGNRDQYFISRGISKSLVNLCEELITVDIKKATDETIQWIILSHVKSSRYEKASTILHVLAQAIRLDNRAVIKHAYRFGQEWEKELGIKK